MEFAILLVLEFAILLVLSVILLVLSVICKINASERNENRIMILSMRREERCWKTEKGIVMEFWKT
jgi:hypothetical protein